MVTNNSKKLEVGLIGLGKMGIMHACLLNIFPNVRVSALCDKSRLMRILAKRIISSALITDTIDKFDGLNLDAIFVLTPIPSHYPIIKEIYSRNLARNVFVEKTLTSSYNKSQELFALSKNHGNINMVGYMKRYGVTFNQARTLLDKQVLGELISFEAYAFSSDFADVPEGSQLSKARGGVLEDLGSHVADLALWFFGDLKVASAKINSKIAVDSQDAISFDVAGSNRLEGKFEVSWCKLGYRMPEFGLSIRGKKGTLSVNDDEVKLELNQDQVKRWYRLDLNDNVDFFLGGPEYYREDKHFIESAISGEATRSDFESALKVDYLLEQVRRKVIND
jgi:predicted dehydrogenase